MMHGQKNIEVCWGYSSLIKVLQVKRALYMKAGVHL